MGFDAGEIEDLLSDSGKKEIGRNHILKPAKKNVNRDAMQTRFFIWPEPIRSKNEPMTIIIGEIGCNLNKDFVLGYVGSGALSVRITDDYDAHVEMDILLGSDKVGFAKFDGCDLTTLHLDEEHRKKGIGTITTRFILEMMAIYGCNEVYGHTVPDSISFWHHLGFIIGEEAEDGLYQISIDVSHLPSCRKT